MKLEPLISGESKEQRAPKKQIVSKTLPVRYRYNGVGLMASTQLTEYMTYSTNKVDLFYALSTMAQRTQKTNGCPEFF